MEQGGFLQSHFILQLWQNQEKINYHYLVIKLTFISLQSKFFQKQRT